MQWIVTAQGAIPVLYSVRTSADYLPIRQKLIKSPSGEHFKVLAIIFGETFFFLAQLTNDLNIVMVD